MTPEAGAVRPSRRIVFQGLSALGVAAVLAGCGGDGESAPRASTPSSDETSAGPSEPGKAASGKPKEPKQAKQPEVDALATTDEIPVGGGIVLTGERIVITQPNRGEFQAFSAVCTHQGQTVGEVQDNTITCNFHGSQYDAATGEVTNGPATAGLDPVQVRVKGDTILRA